MLLDIVGNVGVVMSGIAWFSVLAADPSQQSTMSVARHILAAAIYLLTVWVVGNQPIALYEEVCIVEVSSVNAQFYDGMVKF
jgi:hypothetical protein